MTLREGKKLVKDYYQYQNEKLDSIRKVTCNREIFDEEGNVVSHSKDEAFLCTITNENGIQVTTLCYIGRDAHGENYATELSSGDEQSIIEEWQQA